MKRALIPDAKPETVRQAKRWDVSKQAYVRAGLCEYCAGQAAWGHQIGFTKSHPPCADCAPVVAAFPQVGPAGTEWRRFDSAANAGGTESTGVSPGGPQIAHPQAAAGTSGGVQ